MNLNPTSFNLTTLTDSSPLNLAANYSSTVSSFPCPSCAADNSTLVEAHLAGLAKNREKWVSQGFEVRPDGYPITDLTASECKSYSPECRHTYRDTFLSYDFVVDLGKVREVGVEVVDRWDMRERAIEGLLGVEEEDIVSRVPGEVDDCEVKAETSETNSTLSRIDKLTTFSSPIATSLPPPHSLLFTLQTVHTGTETFLFQLSQLSLTKFSYSVPYSEVVGSNRIIPSPKNGPNRLLEPWHSRMNGC